MVSDYIAERMLDVADSEGLADAALPLVRCYDLLEELRTECNQHCHDSASNVNACLQNCWGGWKYGRLTCRLRYSWEKERHYVERIDAIAVIYSPIQSPTFTYEDSKMH